MKRIYKIVSTVLAALMLSALLPVYTFAATKINSASYASVSPSGPGNYTNYSSMIISGSGYTFTYPLSLPKGSYHLTISVGASDGEVTFAVGDSSITQKVTGANANTRSDKYFGKIDFPGGDVNATLKVQGGTVGIGDIVLEKAADTIETNFSRTEGAYRNYYLPARIEAEDFDMGADAYLTTRTSKTSSLYREDSYIPLTAVDNGYTIALYNTEWAKYTFNVTETGSYDMYLDTRSASNFNVYFDNMVNPIPVNVKEAGKALVNTFFFEKGKHTMRIEAADTRVELDAIVFESAADKGYNPEDLGVAPVAEKDASKKNPVWKEVWVDAAAADGGDGTKANPFNSVEAAKAYVRTINARQEGDIVVQIMPGEYVLKDKLVFDEEDSGQNGYRIIYRGYNALERPLISGGTRVTGWKEHEKGVWKTYLPEVEDMRQLYVNGFAAQRARSKYVYTVGNGYDNPETEYAIDGYYISKLNFPVISNPQDAEIAFNQLWTVQRAPLKDIREDGNGNYILECDQPYFNGIQTNYNNSIVPLPGSKGYLENAYELIDEPGEFYFDKYTHELFYYPYPEENLQTADTVIGRTEFMAELFGTSKTSLVKSISFDNLDFRYGTWLDVSRTGLSTFQADCLVDENFPASNVQGNGRTMPAAIQVRYAKDINITNCNFQNIGSSAIFMDEYVKDSIVDGNVFHDISGTAVSVGTWRVSASKNTPDDLTENIDVTNNVIVRPGLDYYGSPAIGVYYARDVKTEHNYIQDTPYTGITYGWGWGSVTPKELECSNHSIRYNRIIDNSNTVKDGGPIYTLGEMKNTFIEYNYLTDSRDFGGIYFDSGSSEMTCRYNVLEDQEQSGIFGAGSMSVGLLITENWANIPNIKRSEFPVTERSQKDLPLVFEDKNWPDAALEVMKNAGPERGYERLMAGTEYPTWRKDIWEFENSINEFYKSVNVIEKLSPEWKEGGEGVGFHLEKDRDEPRVYDLGLNVSVGDTRDGEWLAYDIEVEKGGTFDMEVYYSFLSSSGGDNVKSTTGLNVYIDDQLVVDKYMLPSTGSWDAYLPTTVGEGIPISEGKHVVKIEFINAFAYEKFKLFNTEFTETEPEFDDGVMLSRKGE